jgi:hypothetical protein
MQCPQRTKSISAVSVLEHGCMDRATRFLWDMHCGRKDRKMFQKAMGLLCQVIQQTGGLTLLTDGERRYGNLLFELCRQAGCV